MIVHLWWWLQHVTGVDAPGSRTYNFWSGFGSDLTEFAILGYIIQGYRHHKCVLCHRIARHPVEGTHYKTCHRHATLEIHKDLHEKHYEEYPEQHALLNKHPE